MASRSRENANPSPQRRSTRTTRAQQQPTIVAVQTAHGLTPRRQSISSQTSTIDQREYLPQKLLTPPVSLQDEPLAKGTPRTRKGVPMPPNSVSRRATHGRPRAGSQRSDQPVIPSPAKPVEPTKQWPPLRQSRATRTPEPGAPDSDEVEVEMSLIQDQPFDDPAVGPSETTEPPTNGSFKRTTIRLLGWPVMLFLVCWATAALLYGFQVAFQHATTPFVPQIPLRYTAWAVSSSAERLYPVAQPILRISPMVKTGIQPGTVALRTFVNALEKTSPETEPIQDLKKYIATSIFYQDEIIKIAIRMETDLDSTLRDLSTARKLILRLLPHRQEASLPRDFESESQLLDTLSRLIIDKLPAELHHLNVRLFELTQHWNRVHAALEKLHHSTQVLSTRNAEWARVDGSVKGLHAMMFEVNNEVTKSRSAVEGWQRDLALFKDPKQVPSNYVVSNASLNRLVDRMNTALDQLRDLRRP